MRIIKYSNEIVSKDCNKFIIEVLERLKEVYPNIKEWFFNKVVTDIGNNREIILLEFKKQIVALLILKYNEKKISTIYVHPDFRHKGFGRLMIKISKRELNTFKPKITISDKCLDLFKNLLEIQQFKKSGVICGKYKEGVVEHYFNYKEDEFYGDKP